MKEEEIGSWETKKIADTVRKTLDKKGYLTRIYRRKNPSLSNKPYEYILYAMKPTKPKKYHNGKEQVDWKGKKYWT